MQFANLPLPLRLSFDDESSVPACRAVMREAEKVERLRSPHPDPTSPFSGIFAEHDQPGLVLMKRKAKLGQSLRKASQHLPRVRFALEGHHKVVGIAHNRYKAVGLLAPAVDPEIEDVVQEDIGQEWAYARSLGRDLAPEKRLPRPMMYDFGNGSKMDEEIADGLHA
jgi:hypothetical protein